MSVGFVAAQLHRTCPGQLNRFRFWDSFTTIRNYEIYYPSCQASCSYYCIYMSVIASWQKAYVSRGSLTDTVARPLS